MKCKCWSFPAKSPGGVTGAAEGGHHQRAGMVSARGCGQDTHYVPYRCDQVETQLLLPPIAPTCPMSAVVRGLGLGVTEEMHRIRRCGREERKFHTSMKVIF